MPPRTLKLMAPLTPTCASLRFTLHRICRCYQLAHIVLTNSPKINA